MCLLTLLMYAFKRLVHTVVSSSSYISAQKIFPMMACDAGADKRSKASTASTWYTEIQSDQYSITLSHHVIPTETSDISIIYFKNIYLFLWVMFLTSRFL